MSEQANVEKIDFIKKFEEERADWSEKIRQLSIRMKNVRELGEVQVELFSNRQFLLEYVAKLGQVMSKLNSRYRKDRGDKLRHYSENSQVKYGSNEKTPLIEGDLSELKERIDLVDSQISYLNETIKTVDFMLYGVKDRIRLQEFMMSSSVK